MPSIEFEIWCSCGNGLCNQTENIKGGIEIDPCKKCIEQARNEGYDQGYSDRQSEEV